MKQVDIDKYNEEFDQKLEKLGYDTLKIDRLCERSAHMVAPLFNLYGITWGDRIPDVYYIAFSIKELVVSVLERGDKDEDDGGIKTTRSGRLLVVRHRYEDGDDDIIVSFELGDDDITSLR